MKTISKVRNIVLLALVAAFGMGSFAITAKANLLNYATSSTSQITDKNIASDQDKITVAATSPWTTARMMTAKPYPLIEAVANSNTLAANPLAGPDGPAGVVAGAAPATTSAKDMLSDAEDLLSNVRAYASSYSYPPPFTSLYVKQITNDTTQWPFIAVGKLFFTQLGQDYVCSASVIGRNAIVTAGQCAHVGNGSSTGWSTDVIFVPAYKNGVAPYGQWTISKALVKNSWYSLGEIRTDIGVMKVNTLSGAHIGDRVGYLGYAYNQSRVQHWWEIGYPQAAPRNGKYMMACQSSYAYDSPFGSTKFPPAMGAGCDMTNGASGGPWILAFGSHNYVNGVISHRRAGNSLELFSPYIDTNIKLLLDKAFAW